MTRDYPLTLLGSTVGSNVPIIRNIYALRHWLLLTEGKGWIKDRVLKVRRMDLEATAFSQRLRGWQRDTIRTLLAKPRPFYGSPVELVG